MTTWPRRRLGSALMGFGAIGLALLIAIAVLVTLSLDGLGRAATDLARQRNDAMAMLEPAAAALDEAAGSAERAGTSLTSAAGAARSAADLMNRLAGAFEGMATLGSFDLFGTRPFGAVTGEFSGVATQARALSSDLGTTAASLDANVADSATVATDLRALANQLDRLRTSVTATESQGATDPSSAGTLLRTALVVILGLLAWLAVIAVAAVEIGRRWRRTPERTLDSGVDSGG